MVVLVVRGLMRRPSLSGSPTVTFCSVHIHNVVAKKRDASTDLLRRFHAHMLEHNVGFIGGDFNISAFSPVGDVFSDAEFSAPGSSFLWGLGALEDSNRERTGFLIMPKSPYEWRVDTHGCYKFNNADLALGSRDTTARLPVFLHLRSTHIPGPATASPAASKLGRGAWNVKPPDMSVDTAAEDSPSFGLLKCLYRRCGKTQRGQSPCRDSSLVYLTARTYTPFQFRTDEADEGEVARQDHMSAHHLTPSAVMIEL